MASSASGIRAGQAYVEMYADQSRLERGLKQSVDAIKGFAGKARTAFSAAFGPVGLAVNALSSAVEGPLGDAFGFISGQARGLFDAAVIQNFGDGIGAVGGELKAIWDLVYQQLGRVINGIIQNLAPGFQKGADKAKGLLAVVRDWLMKNEQVISSFIKIATSGEVLWTGLKLAWVEGTSALMGTWNSFLGSMVSSAVVAGNKIASLLGKDGALTDGGIGAALSKDNAEMAAKVAAARKAFEDAVARAKNRNIDLNIPGAAPEIQAAIGSTGPRSAVTGTFAAGAVRGLGSVNYVSQIAANTKRMTEYQLKLLEDNKRRANQKAGLPVN